MARIRKRRSRRLTELVATFVWAVALANFGAINNARGSRASRMSAPSSDEVSRPAASIAERSLIGRIAFSPTLAPATPSVGSASVIGS
jgi:hypothetical protein